MCLNIEQEETSHPVSRRSAWVSTELAALPKGRLRNQQFAY